MDTKTKNKSQSKAVNIYLTPSQKKLIEEEASKRALSLSSFLKSTVLEKIAREKSLVGA